MGNAVPVDSHPDFPGRQGGELLGQAPLAHRIPLFVHTPDPPVIGPHPRCLVIQVRKRGNLGKDPIPGRRGPFRILWHPVRHFHFVLDCSRVPGIGIDRIEQQGTIGILHPAPRHRGIPIHFPEAAPNSRWLGIIPQRLAIQIKSPDPVIQDAGRLFLPKFLHRQQGLGGIDPAVPVQGMVRRLGRIQIQGDAVQHLQFIPDSIQLFRPVEQAQIRPGRFHHCLAVHGCHRRKPCCPAHRTGTGQDHRNGCQCQETHAQGLFFQAGQYFSFHDAFPLT